MTIRKICTNCYNTNIVKYGQDYVCRDCLYTIDTDEYEMTSDVDITMDYMPSVKSRVSICGHSELAKRVGTILKYITVQHHEKTLYNLKKEITAKIGRHLNIVNRNNTKCIPTELINNTIKLYANIINISKKIYRDPLKMGIIAMCFYYISKDNYVIHARKALANIFEIKQTYITDGNNNINRLCRENSEIGALINRDPITLYDMIDKIAHSFSTLTTKDINNLKKILKRVINSQHAIANTPQAVMSGIFYNYIKYNNINTISKKDIVKKLDISISSIGKYSKLFKYAMYNYEIQHFKF